MNLDMDRMIDAMTQRFYGKYRGEVVSTDDSTSRGRLQVKCPAVMGEELLWALPCVPYAGEGVGMFALPPAGTSIWVEFEGGEINQPIWAGCYWKEGEIDSADAVEGIAFLKTPGATLRIDNDGGTIEIETSGGTKITLSGDSITLESPEMSASCNGGSIKVSGSGFDAMSGAFTVS